MEEGLPAAVAQLPHDLAPVERLGNGLSVGVGENPVRDAKVVSGAGRREAVELDVPDDAAILHEPNSAHGSPP